MSTPAEEAEKVRKYLFWAAIACVAASHIVRTLTFHVGPPPEDVFKQFPDGFHSYVVHKLDSVRKDIAVEVDSWSTQCSEEHQKYCVKLINGGKLLLGLH